MYVFVQFKNNLCDFMFLFLFFIFNLWNTIQDNLKKVFVHLIQQRWSKTFIVWTKRHSFHNIINISFVFHVKKKDIQIWNNIFHIFSIFLLQCSWIGVLVIFTSSFVWCRLPISFLIRNWGTDVNEEEVDEMWQLFHNKRKLTF